MEKSNKDQYLKNNDENSSVDTKINEKQSNLSDNVEHSGVSSKNDEHPSSSDNNLCTGTSNNVSDCNVDLAVLNEISKAAQMAMSSISFLSVKISDKEMKKELVAIYSGYSNILLQVNQHFEKYGEVPDDTPISTKMIGFFGIQMNTLKDRSSSHAAEMMIQGTLMGIIKCQKILNSNLNVSESTTKLLKDFNDFQRKNIEKLNAYL